MNKVVLAHFRKQKLLKLVIFSGVFLAVVTWVLFFESNGHFLKRVYEEGGIWFPMIVLGILGASYLLWLDILFIRQALFRKLEAVWIDDDAIVYLNGWYFSVKLRDVESVSIGTYGCFNYPMIVFQLDSGAQKQMPTGALFEDRGSILKAVNAAIFGPRGFEPR